MKKGAVSGTGRLLRLDVNAYCSWNPELRSDCLGIGDIWELAIWIELASPDDPWF